MTSVLLDSIGLCVNYSQQGDWAFDLALSIARKRNLQLNIFHFLADPYNPEDQPPKGLSRDEINDIIVDKERYLRFYYDERLGDHLKAGFRVCEDNEWTELHHCLLKREFQLMVIPYTEATATFGGKPIEEFAQQFIAPLLLVGPDSPTEVLMNPPAKLIVEQLELVDSARLIGDVKHTSLV